MAGPLLLEGVAYELTDDAASAVARDDFPPDVVELDLWLASAVEDLAAEVLARFPSVVASAARYVGDDGGTS